MNQHTVDKIFAALAAHNGLLRVRDAEPHGVDRVTLKRAADAGLIRHAGWGKYASIDAPLRELQFRGLHLGCDAVLSFLGAAYYWALDGVNEMILEWSIPHTTRATAVGLVCRRRNFHRLEVVEKNGVVVTSVRQTLLDVAARWDLDLVERMLESAIRKGLVTDAEMRLFVEEHAHWQGAPAMRAVLARRKPGERPTGSDDETITLQLYRADGLQPVRQFKVIDADGHTMFGDFGFPPKACITEVDGLETHDVANRQYDYNRRGRLEDLGFLVRQFTHEDVRYRGAYVCRRTRAAIEVARYL